MSACDQVLLQPALRCFNNTLIFCSDIEQHDALMSYSDRAEQTELRTGSQVGCVHYSNVISLPLIPVGRGESLLKTATVESRHSMPCAGHHQLGLAQHQHYQHQCSPGPQKPFVSENRQRERERWGGGNLKRELYYLFSLDFSPYNTFNFNVSFIYGFYMLINRTERGKKENSVQNKQVKMTKRRRTDSLTVSSYSSTPHQTFLDSNASRRPLMLYRTIKACPISDYNHHQITIIQSTPGGWCSRSCMCHGHTCAQGHWLALGSLGKLSSLESLQVGGTYTHNHTHTHILQGMYIV